MKQKIKRIEELLAGWKASKKSWEQTSCPESVLQATWMIKGMELALRVIREPSNTQSQIDATEPCRENCVAPSEKCAYFKTFGCRWHD